MAHLATLFRALADPNRLRIVNILSHRELCVCDLQTVLGMPQPFISRHLAYLRRAKLVKDRREGTRVCYSLAMEDALGRALRSLLQEAVRDSILFQSDVATLIKQASTGQLKSAVSEVNPEQLASRAA